MGKGTRNGLCTASRAQEAGRLLITISLGPRETLFRPVLTEHHQHQATSCFRDALCPPSPKAPKSRRGKNQSNHQFLPTALRTTQWIPKHPMDP